MASHRAAHHAHRRVDACRNRDWHSAWHLRGKTCLGRAAASGHCRDSADGSQLGHAGASADADRENRSGARDHRADAVCAASDRAQHGDGTARDCPIDCRSGPRGRYDTRTTAFPCRDAAGAPCDCRGSSYGCCCGRGHCNALRLHRRRRTGSIHQSRARAHQYGPYLVGRYSLSAASAGGGWLDRGFSMGHRNTAQGARSAEDLDRSHRHGTASAHPRCRRHSVLVHVKRAARRNAGFDKRGTGNAAHRREELQRV